MGSECSQSVLQWQLLPDRGRVQMRCLLPHWEQALKSKAGFESIGQARWEHNWHRKGTEAPDDSDVPKITRSGHAKKPGLFLLRVSRLHARQHILPLR
ncbi:hypothetical protein NDU88_006432 [Pleurodeles waltl]|uniref:Uncharacterized protein n=1 Tax=Pleurodeles waltl TaxID=8319 RepID=A0AAV7SPI7_PLEWA|nr:hypothetical protein NDU88_006432 [Pleurodeles waltl]